MGKLVYKLQATELVKTLEVGDEPLIFPVNNRGGISFEGVNTATNRLAHQYPDRKYKVSRKGLFNEVKVTRIK